MSNRKITIFIAAVLTFIFIFSIVSISNQTSLKPAGEAQCYEPVDFDLMDYIYVDNLPNYTWEFPLSDFDNREVTSDFGLRRHPISGYPRFHQGVDFWAAPGEDVFAMSSGTVTRAGWFGGYGICVVIEHENGITSTYAHLSRSNKTLSVGDIVSTGQVIGYVGSTGVATGPHLHFEIRLDDKPIDPLDHLVKLGGGNYAPIR